MQLGHQVRQALTIKHEHIAWSAAIRGAVIVAGLVGIAVATGHPSAALYLGIGSLFAGIATINETTVQRRAEGILIALSLALGTLLGSLLAPYDGWNVLTVGFLSLLAGFAACLGRRAALVGTVFVANYAFSVAGITIAILVLDSFLGQSIVRNVPLRFECTLWAAAIAIGVWLFTSPWRRWITPVQPPTPTLS